MYKPAATTFSFSIRSTNVLFYLGQVSDARLSIPPVDPLLYRPRWWQDWLVQGERSGRVGAKTVAFGREDLWFADYESGFRLAESVA